MVDINRYYGVYIPKDSFSSDQNYNETLHVYSTKEEVHKIVKEHKSARFKCFSTVEEASYFASNGSASGPGNPNVISESTPYKSLKRQEIFKFRRYIETDDFESVKTLIFENPRYLIGIGDTPTIMMEGPRYNALHIAAKNNRAKIADLILKTVANESFCQLLYGTAGDNSYLIRSEKMVDLYLNTPDKSLNETALHFAAKYGFIDVVKVFVQYPKLEFSPKNKKGQTPKEITCELANSNDLKPLIHKLLDPDELFFVPIWRSDDDVERPIIGNPFSPKSPPVCPVPTSPLSPTREIKAVAGPMSHEEAARFQETWTKSPKKIINCGTPHISKGILLRSPLNSERGLETVGRTLAKQRHISWTEYWPFLGCFVNLSSEEGLNLLEDYLGKIIINSNCSRTNNNFIPSFPITSPVSELCNAFSKFSISSPNVICSGTENNNKKVTSITSTPYLLMENLCVSFAKNLLDIFADSFSQKIPVEDNVVILIKKTRNLSISIEAYRKDSIFKDFPFNKIHSRIAIWITRNLSRIRDGSLHYVTDIFRIIHATNKNEMMQCISLSPSSANVELDGILLTLNCINERIVKLLGYEILFEEVPRYEDCCRKEWSGTETCSCFIEDDNNTINRSNNKNGVRKILFPDYIDSEENKNSKVTNFNYACDNFAEFFPNDQKNCDNENDDNDTEEIFYTPPTSASVSEDEMDSAEEGPDLHIYNNKGTSMDNAVLEALVDVNIDPSRYPNVYRWKHSVLLYPNIKRLNWPSPNVKQSKQKKFLKRSIQV